MSHPYVKVATSLQNRAIAPQTSSQIAAYNDRNTLSERVLARWQCLVAFMKALDLLHWAMHAV
jgi:hypothetical protein